MDLKLDNQPVEIIENDAAPLRQVIERVSNQLKERNRVICEIFVNGRAMAGWDDPKMAAMTVGQCASMMLVSEEPRRLAIKVLYDIAGYMSKIKEALVETSTLIQSRKEEEGMQRLEQIMSTWSELYQGFRNALIVTGLDLREVTVQNQTFAEINEEVHQLLETISEVVQDQRFLELSDILEYELAPKMPLLEEGIYRLVRELERNLN